MMNRLRFLAANRIRIRHLDCRGAEHYPTTSSDVLATITRMLQSVAIRWGYFTLFRLSVGVGYRFLAGTEWSSALELAAAFVSALVGSACIPELSPWTQI